MLKTVFLSSPVCYDDDMKVQLPYAKGHLVIDVPDHATVVRGKPVQPVADEARSVRLALKKPVDAPPLAEMVGPGDAVVIVHTDGTRPTPNRILLPVIAEELLAAGVSKRNIKFLNATGSHVAQPADELAAMLGPAIAGHYTTLQHNAFDADSLAIVGTTRSGNTVALNRAYVDADFRIVTGFIEPHFFAGYSGGPKLVLPGIAGIESIMRNHSPAHIAHPHADWGITGGNPLWDEIAEAARLCPPQFCCHVSLDEEKRVTGVFAGELFAAHAAGCAFVQEHAMAPVKAPFDIVVTSNSGHPLDRNFYQTVKGLSAAARIVGPGGSIIMASACEDGLPETGGFTSILDGFGEPAEARAVLAGRGSALPDQWQVQILARVLSERDVFMFSGGLSDADLARAWVHRSRSIEETLSRLMDLYGAQARIGVLPEGPQVIPYIV